MMAPLRHLQGEAVARLIRWSKKLRLGDKIGRIA
jgi:hypothetical protein